MTAAGLADSRERAKSLIMAGKVLVNGQKIDKAGTKIDPALPITLIGEDLPFVSRGGLKLQKALNCFDLDITGAKALDIGASTGGFTDCMLQRGAAQVVAVDVGYGQLAWKLRTDARVINMERTNIRNVTADMLPFVADFVSVDVAFISLTKVLPVIKKLISDTAKIVALIKPQFEAGREYVGKKGVVRDKNVHMVTVARVIDFCRKEGLYPLRLSYSPVKGPNGNIEFLLLIGKSDEGAFIDEVMIKQTVDEAHEELDGRKNTENV